MCSEERVLEPMFYVWKELIVKLQIGSPFLWHT